MNENHLNRIFANYIEQFELLNNSEHVEYRKWQIAKDFRPVMDDALASSDEEFPQKLAVASKLSKNLINNFTTPFNGLVQFAKEEPQTVKTMFIDLYSDDCGDLEIRQKKIEDFIQRSQELRDKYFPGSFMYSETTNSVTGYLFLYDPDHNYQYKATNAHYFANAIEFIDDWGSGIGTKIPVFYRMCDYIRDKALKNDTLLKTDESRFHNNWGIDPETFYKDPEKHVLVQDLLYCCLPYDLIDWPVTPPDSRILSLNRDTAKKLVQNLKNIEQDIVEYDEACQYLNRVFSPGTAIVHKKYGEGTIISNEDGKLTISFSGRDNLVFGEIVSARNEIIWSKDPSYAEKIAAYKSILQSDGNTLLFNKKQAEKMLEPYKAILDEI